MKKELIINGNNFSDRSGFTLEIRRNFTKDLSWIDYKTADDINLDSINDLLQGGFGVYEYKEPIVIRWSNSIKSKKDLSKEETLGHLNHMLRNCHPTNIEKINERIEAVLKDRGEILFDSIVDMIKGNGHIELVLE